jgi:hypothetical protein
MQEVGKLFFALLLAHLLADFPFQPSRLVAQKVRHWWAHGLHGSIHLGLLIFALLIFVPSLPVFTGRLLFAAVAYVAVHVVIDLSKQLLLQRGVVQDSTNVFLTDQTLHLASVVVLTVFITRVDWPAIQSLMALRNSTKDLILSGGVVYTIVVFAGGYLIRYMTRGLLRGVSSQLGESVEQLTNAGLYIGWLERLLIVTAVVLRSPTLIGLILTAKSIARFPELKEPKFAEYFLIGTLLSVIMALFGGLVLLKFWYGAVSLQ